MREKKPLTYAGKKSRKIAIVLDSELSYKRANYPKLFYKEDDKGKGLSRRGRF